MRIAAIDIGTNSVLMLIAERAGDALAVVLERAEVTRLGQGVDRTRRLDDAAMARTLAVLERYAVEAQALGAAPHVVGTSAMRDAHNGAEFTARVRALFGTEPQTISGEREARLTFAGALEGLGIDQARASVIDIGGGSTEVVAVQDGALHATSLDIGSVRLSERFGLTAPTPREACDRVRAFAEDALRASAVRLRPTLVATAGTATTLAAIEGRVEPFDPARVHGRRITLDALRALIARLARLDLAARAAVPGLGAPRADVIVAGALVLEAACAIAGADAFTVSCTGLRYGLAREALGLGTLSS